MASEQMLRCSCCKQEKDASSFSKCPTKRGYNYHCKSCINDRTKEKRKQTTTTTNTSQPTIDNTQSLKMTTGLKHENTYVFIIMESALRYVSTFEQFVDVITSFIDVVDFQVVCDTSFKYCRQHFPEYYTNLITILYDLMHQHKNNALNDANDANNANDANVNDANNAIVNEKLNIAHSYINQYKNDENMQQVGEDIESDEEYSVMTVRSDDQWAKIRVKKS